MNKNYYTLKEIESITGLKYRQLQNRILTVKEEYKNKPSLISKINGKWNISEKLLSEFERKRNPINYKLFTTISSKNNYEYEYWYIVINNVNKEIITNLDKYNRTKFVIEENKKGVYHLHFSTTFNDKKLLLNLINNNIYIIDNDMNILVKSVYNVEGLDEYFNKEKKPTLIRKKY